MYIIISGVSEAPQNITTTANGDVEKLDEVTFKVKETVTVGTAIATISAEDKDTDSTMTFALMDGDGTFSVSESPECNQDVSSPHTGQIWAQSGSDRPQMEQVHDFIRPC